MAISYTRVVYIPHVDLKLVISTKSGARDFMINYYHWNGKFASEEMRVTGTLFQLFQ